MKTVIVAAVIAGTCSLFGVDPLKSFIVGIVGQFVFFYVWNSVMSFMLRMRVESEETNRITEWAKQGVEAQCAYCGAINYIPIRLDEENEFTCTECDKQNSVYVNITTAQQTDTLDKDRLSVSAYISEKLKMEETIKNKPEEDE